MRIIKVPLSIGGMGKTNGCELAPEEVIKQSNDLYLNESGKVVDITLDEIKINNSNISESFESIEAFATKLGSDFVNKIKDDENPEKIFFIGGDHSITYPIMRGLLKDNYLGLVVFDAHPDCENYFKPPTHEDYLRTLVEEKTIEAKNILLVGLRNWDDNEVQFLKDFDISYVTMSTIVEKGILWLTDVINDFSKEFDGLYCSIDIDVVDPGFAPATGYIEPGGLSSREMISILSKIRKNVIFGDIVEINPKKDFNNMTSKLGAKLLWELERVKQVK